MFILSFVTQVSEQDFWCERNTYLDRVKTVPVISFENRHVASMSTVHM